MWELKKHTKLEEASYFEEVFKVIKKRVEGYPQPIKDVFSNEDVMKILILADPIRIDVVLRAYET